MEGNFTVSATDFTHTSMEYNSASETPEQLVNSEAVDSGDASKATDSYFNPAPESANDVCNTFSPNSLADYKQDRYGGSIELGNSSDSAMHPPRRIVLPNTLEEVIAQATTEINSAVKIDKIINVLAAMAEKVLWCAARLFEDHHSEFCATRIVQCKAFIRIVWEAGLIFIRDYSFADGRMEDENSIDQLLSRKVLITNLLVEFQESTKHDSKSICNYPKNLMEVTLFYTVVDLANQVPHDHAPFLQRLMPELLEMNFSGGSPPLRLCGRLAADIGEKTIRAISKSRKARFDKECEDAAAEWYEHGSSADGSYMG